MTDSEQTRLATYGTLGPGKPNHHQISDLPGTWHQGHVRGRLVAEGWGAAMGYPGLVLDPGGPKVEVELFQSAELPDHWDRLDAFEGDGYRRAVTSVETGSGLLAACIYVLARDPADRPRDETADRSPPDQRPMP